MPRSILLPALLSLVFPVIGRAVGKLSENGGKSPSKAALIPFAGTFSNVHGITGMDRMMFDISWQRLPDMQRTPAFDARVARKAIDNVDELDPASSIHQTHKDPHPVVRSFGHYLVTPWKS